MDGEGGNVFHNITIAPPEGYLIGSNADGFHSTDVATGPTLSGSQLTNIENDFFSTHATMHIAVPLPEPRSHNFMLIDPREFAFGTAAAAGTIDEYYGTASPLNHVVNGTDTVSCYDFNSFAPIGQSVIGELKEVLTHHNLPLPQLIVILRSINPREGYPALTACVPCSATDHGRVVYQELPCQGQPRRAQWHQHGCAPQPKDAIMDVGQALERDVRLTIPVHSTCNSGHRFCVFTGCGWL